MGRVRKKKKRKSVGATQAQESCSAPPPPPIQPPNPPPSPRGRQYLRGLVVFWAGLSLLALAFFAVMTRMYKSETAAPTTTYCLFPPAKGMHNRSLQVQLTDQLPREPLFAGKLFIAFGDAPFPSQQLTIIREPVGVYGRSVETYPIYRDAAFGAHIAPQNVEFPANDTGHIRFPFDSSQMNLAFSFQPMAPINIVLITGRVPGFVLSADCHFVQRLEDGSIRLRFSLRRDPFMQTFCVAVLLSGFVFILLILATQSASALPTSVAAFFFSLWSIRGVLAPEIRIFPTIFDYGIFSLCFFALAGLILRLLTHPELRSAGRAP
jgi:hypothetical protein